MKLKIRSVILYPKNKKLKPRFITFEENMVNVITGYSQRGKSALIPIIDYCLGSGECNIPIGMIQDIVDKFAININLNDENIFLARNSPENARSSDIMFLYHVKEKGENEAFTTNAWIESAEEYKYNREAIKKYLGNVAGFKNLSENEDVSNIGFDAPASFRDTAAFLFQPQNIIANPTTIFYKTDTFSHLVKLQKIFPLILGYKSFDMLIVEKEIEALKKEEKAKFNMLQNLKDQYENWQSNIYEYYTKAISLGLTNADINIESSKVDVIKEELDRIVKTVHQNGFQKEGASLRYAEKLEDLDKQRLVLIRELDSLKINLSKLEQFDRSKDIYITDVATEVENRLKPIDWFLKLNGTDNCPFCDSKSDKAIDELLSLRNDQQQNNQILVESKTLAYSFEKEKQDFKRDIVLKEKLIAQIERNIGILLNENQELHVRFQDIYEFVGKIEHVLENLNMISPSGELDKEINHIQNKLFERLTEFERLAQKYDKEHSLKKVTEAIGHYLKLLPIEEKAKRKVLLDPEKSASIKILDTETNNTTFLSKIGSGANHMCYHIATLLGLHEYFLKLPEEGKINYVPSFLVLDQPSQVYFPEEYPDKDGNVPGKKKERISQDIANTSRIFNACSEFMKRTNYQTQIIILEHAPASTWENIHHIKLTKEWRGELGEEKYDALIPQQWLPT